MEYASQSKNKARFIKVMKIRIDVDKLYYDQITIESEELRTKEVNSDVHMMKIEYEGGKERERTEAKKNILERGRKFRDCKNKLEDSINQFKKLSQKTLVIEFVFNSRFISSERDPFNGTSKIV